AGLLGGVLRRDRAVALAGALWRRVHALGRRGELESGAGGSGSGEREQRGARGVEVGADAVERLARVARREALELAVDRVARADLDLAVARARVEAVRRADRRPARPPD